MDAVSPALDNPPSISRHVKIETQHSYTEGSHGILGKHQFGMVNRQGEEAVLEDSEVSSSRPVLVPRPVPVLLNIIIKFFIIYFFIL